MRLFVALVCACLASAVMAGSKAHAEGATVIVYGTELITFQTGSGSFTPEKRALAAVDVIKSSFGLPVSVEGQDGAYRILLGQHKVMTLNAAEAKAHRLNAQQLASRISKKLQSTLDKMPFDLSTRQIWLPPDGKVEISVIGNGAGKLSFNKNGRDNFKVEQNEATLIVIATEVGLSELTLTYEDYSETIPINVLPYAADIRSEINATVTGRPADKWTVTAAALRALRAAITPRKNGVVALDPISVPSLVPSQKGKAKFLARITAPGFYPYEKELTVNLKNIGMASGLEQELWYSNFPENVKEPGRLFWGKLENNKPIRLLFHHINVAQRPMRFRYLLVNSSDQTAKASVLISDAEAHLNPTYIGYKAGQSFLKRWSRQSSAIIEVPPHSYVPIIYQEATPNLTVSGLATLSTVEGSLTLIADADWSEAKFIDKQNYAHELGVTSLAKDPINLVGSGKHIYGPTIKNIEVEYKVGGRFGFVRIGQEPIKRIDQEGQLDGNFGVVYLIKAKISNPTDVEQEIEIVYESSAGYGGAVFDLNGILKSTPMLQPKQSYQLLTITLKPGETKSLHLNTIPLSGGSYPVTMTIKPVGLG